MIILPQSMSQEDKNYIILESAIQGTMVPHLFRK